MIHTKKALFLDRDGIINEDKKYPYKPEDIVFIPAIFDLCKAALLKGYIIIVVTNQAGVAKGYFTEGDVQKLHAWMTSVFLEKGISIAGFYYCPYHKNGTVTQYAIDSNDRKPKPGMFIKAAHDFGIDISQSIMIGDKNSDRIELSELKCFIVKSQYVLTGYDFETLEQAQSALGTSGF